jgi:Flp pilus assembly protein TadG
MQKRSNHRQNGAAAVEFAIVLPLLIILLFGIIEFALILYDKAVITNASREGARAGIVSKTNRLSDSEITTIVNGYCQNYLISFGTSNTAVGITWLDNDANSSKSFGDELSVSVSYPYSFLVLPNFLTGLTGSLVLTAVTVMRYE